MYNYFDTDFFYLLQSDIYEYETQGKVLLCGDWNARTGARADYISIDRNTNFIDDDCYLPDLPLSRDSVDSVCNSHGLKLLTLCKSTSMRIANGRLFDSNDYTFTCHNGSSIIDYLIVNFNDLYILSAFNVHPFNEWSDHAMLSFSIPCKVNASDANDLSFEKTNIKWNPANLEAFRSGLIIKLTDFNHIVDELNVVRHDSIDICINNFTAAIRDVADPMFAKKSSHGTQSQCLEISYVNQMNGSIVIVTMLDNHT